MTQSARAGVSQPPLSFAADILPAVAAAMLSAPFLVTGLLKLAAPQQVLPYIASAGLPFPPLALAAAIAIELLGGLALVVGWRARTAATVLAGFCLVTAAVFHRDLGDQNQLTHFFSNIAMAGGLLYVAAYGRGRLSLDARRK